MPGTRNGGGGSSTTVENVVSGTQRYKFFKRPIMPRVNAYPPHVLLAPSSGVENNPLEPDVVQTENSTREMAVQTMYRDSEAQTNPYTPNYIIPAGQEPEVLLLKNLTYDNGLPMGEKEMAMIEFARAKREMEMNLPPFTDEASLSLRKTLMEAQELREFRLREAEIDNLRNEKLKQLQEAIQDREESNEFMTSQRLESVRLLKMEEREKVLQKIRNKRIKALRRLAHQRNVSDPILSESASNGQVGRNVDIIDAFFDRGSDLYAPLKREGKEMPPNPAQYDIASRTAPLDNLGNLLSLEYNIPRQLLNGGPASFTPVLASQTMPAHVIREMQMEQRGASEAAMRNQQNYRPRESKIKAAEPRMTSAAARAYRQTKRDVEEMHLILTQKKRGGTGSPTRTGLHSSTARVTDSRPFTDGGDSPQRPTSASPTPGQTSAAGSPAKSATLGGTSSLLAKKPKARPPTPDITRDRPDDFEQVPAGHVQVQSSHHHHGHHASKKQQPSTSSSLTRHDLLESIVLLQRLIRGRAVQNIMFEGKYRRRELIAELQAADEAELEHRAWFELAETGQSLSPGEDSPAVQEARSRRAQREENIRATSLDAVGGSVTSQITQTLAAEKRRMDMIEALQVQADRAIIERRDLEAVEAGRRQRQGMEYPTVTSDGLPTPTYAPGMSVLTLQQLPSRSHSSLSRAASHNRSAIQEDIPTTHTEESAPPQEVPVTSAHDDRPVEGDAPSAEN